MSNIDRVEIAGTGSFIPPYKIPNDVIAALIGRGDRGTEWAKEKFGIESRRFLHELDEQGFPTQTGDELDMAESAALDAIQASGMQPSDVDGIYYISCTQTRDRAHFSKASLELHRRLKLRPNSIPLEMDAGCGGALHALITGGELIVGSERNNILIVASNAPSLFYHDWRAYVESNEWLPMYIFGDGAGAVMLRRQKTHGTNSGIIASFTGVDPNNPLMYYEARTQNPTLPLYIIKAREVAIGFAVYAKAALDGLQAKHPFKWEEVRRFYFHQVNGKVLLAFVVKMGIPVEKVAMHVERYGNIAAAATLVLLDEDLRNGAVKRGDLVVFCTVGAGAQYGAMLVRL